MLNSMSIQWTALLSSVLVCLVILTIAVLLFRYLWLSDHGFFFQQGFYNFKKSNMQKEAVHTF